VTCSRPHKIIPAFVTQNKGFENKIGQGIDMGGNKAENRTRNPFFFQDDPVSE